MANKKISNTISAEIVKEIKYLDDKIGCDFFYFYLDIILTNGLFCLMLIGRAWLAESAWIKRPEAVILCATATIGIFVVIAELLDDVVQALEQFDQDGIWKDETRGLHLILALRGGTSKLPSLKLGAIFSLGALPVFVVLHVAQRLARLDDNSPLSIMGEVLAIMIFAVMSLYEVRKMRRHMTQLKEILQHIEQVESSTSQKSKANNMDYEDIEAQVSTKETSELGENFYVMIYHEYNGEGDFTFCGPLVCRLTEGENLHSLNKISLKAVVATRDNVKLITTEVERGKLIVKYNARNTENFTFANKAQQGIVKLLHREAVRKSHEDED